MKQDLHRALSAIEGVEKSSVELSDHGPLAIQVELARGADRTVVAEAVQRVLEAHGLRSKVAPERRTPGPGRPPAPPAEPGRPAPRQAPPPARGPTGPPVPGARKEPIKTIQSGIEEVTVSESGREFVVVVRADGRTATHRVRRTPSGRDEAIVAAVGQLFDPDAPPPGLRAVERSETFSALTVYLEGADGGLLVGVSLIEGGEPFALARAAWAALVQEARAGSSG